MADVLTSKIISCMDSPPPIPLIFLKIKYESTFANFCYFPTPTWYLLLSALCLKK